MTEDASTGRITIDVRDHEGAAHIANHGFLHSGEAVERYSVLPNDPVSAEGEVTWTHEMRRDDWSVKTITTTKLTCSATEFHIAARLQAFDGEEMVRDDQHAVSIRRNLV